MTRLRVVRSGVGPGDKPPTAGLGDRIKELRKARDMTLKDVSKSVGVDVGTVSRWENGKMFPHAEQLNRLADLFGTSMAELMSGEEAVVPMGAGMEQARRIKLVGELQAGAWREAVEWAHEDQHEIPVYMPQALRGMHLEAYLVRGPSMNVYYPEGTVVIVAATITNGLAPKSGQKVLVQRRDRNGLFEATLKEYVVGADGIGWLWPRSTDPMHQSPLALGGGDDDVTITGIVVMAQVNELLR